MPHNRIALITSVPAEEPLLNFHDELKKKLEKNFAVEMDILKNGEFCLFVDRHGEKAYYQETPFYPERYNLALARMAIKASHGGDHYILRLFEGKNIPVINPSVPLLARRDKLNTLQVLARAEIPVTPTIVVRTREQISQALALAGNPPYIVKNCFGSGGQAVLQASKPSQVYAIFDYVWHIDRNEILLIQPYLGTMPASDVRAIFLGFRPWRAMVRKARHEEFRANVKVGAQTEITELTPFEEEICTKAALCSELPIAGIDFLRTDQGPLILEVNGCPGFEGISHAYAAHDINIINELALFLVEYAKNPSNAAFPPVHPN